MYYLYKRRVASQAEMMTYTYTCVTHVPTDLL